MKKIVGIGVVSYVLAGSVSGGPVTVDFGDVLLAPESYFALNEAGSTVIESGGVRLPHETPSWGGFSKFTVSNQTNTTVGGWQNSGSAITAGGVSNGQYAVGFVGGGLQLEFAAPEGVALGGLYVTNTTYAALSMRDGDAFAKRFGGEGGTDPDWFALTIRGLGSGDVQLGEAEVMLADFRFSDSAMDYIVQDWLYVDLSGFGEGVKALSFELNSSDVGAFGMNTPAYFALDNLSYTAVPEPRLAVLAIGLGALLGIGWRRRLR